MKEACRLIINDILEGKVKSRQDLEKIKRKVCRVYDLEKFMSNIDILEYATVEEKKTVANLLRKKPTRTISGVAIVAVMCHPHDCPHGRCFYCPESDVAPPSYTGEEPAALRARMFNFHPYIQSYNRLKQLHTVGHPVDKVELIIMGGTFPSRDLSYQEWFVSQCLKAFLDFGINLDDIAVMPDDKGVLQYAKETAEKYLNLGYGFNKHIYRPPFMAMLFIICGDMNALFNQIHGNGCGSLTKLGRLLAESMVVIQDSFSRKDGKSYMTCVTCKCVKATGLDKADLSIVRDYALNIGWHVTREGANYKAVCPECNSAK